MPWCPKCKNEYKTGYSVCADCGCNLIEELGEEIIAYFGTEAEVDNLIAFLDSRGFDFANKRYNSKEGFYEVLVQESKKEEIRSTMQEFLARLSQFNDVPVENENISYLEDDLDINIKRYKKPGDRASEYKAGYQTMFLVGGIGIVILVLVDLGIIPLHFAKESKILINVVMGGMFLAFIALGVNSLKTFKKLVAQTNEDEAMEDKITKWFSENVTVELLTASENPKESEEILFFNRFKKLKNMIRKEFPDLDPSFLEYLTDKLYNELFK